MRPFFLTCLLLVSVFAPSLAAPAEGDVAPTFILKTPAGKTVSLTKLRTKKPVVLVFGSYT